MLNIIFTIILLTPQAHSLWICLCVCVCLLNSFACSIRTPTRRKYKSIYVSPVNSATNLKLCCLRQCKRASNFKMKQEAEKKHIHWRKKQELSHTQTESHQVRPFTKTRDSILLPKKNNLWKYVRMQNGSKKLKLCAKATNAKMNMDKKLSEKIDDTNKKTHNNLNQK